MSIDAGVYRKNMTKERDQRIRNEAYRKAAELARTYPDPDEKEGQAYACGWVDASVNIAAAIEAEITE